MAELPEIPDIDESNWDTDKDKKFNSINLDASIHEVEELNRQENEINKEDQSEIDEEALEKIKKWKKQIKKKGAVAKDIVRILRKEYKRLKNGSKVAVKLENAADILYKGIFFDGDDISFESEKGTKTKLLTKNNEWKSSKT